LTKPVYPSKLDTIAGGGLYVGEKKIEVIAREVKEEASIPIHLSLLRLKAYRTVSYHITHSFLGNQGSYPYVLYVYKIELPETFVLIPNNGKVDEFITMTES
jgi:8-oxo-dGTP pyrophosphatase MutT (NUDIX family)